MINKQPMELKKTKRNLSILIVLIIAFGLLFSACTNYDKKEQEAIEKMEALHEEMLEREAQEKIEDEARKKEEAEKKLKTLIGHDNPHLAYVSDEETINRLVEFKKGIEYDYEDPSAGLKHLAFLKGEDPEIIKLKEFSEEVAKTYANVDYNNYKGDALYKYYSDARLAWAKEQKEAEDNEYWIIKDEEITNFERINIDYILLNKDGSEARVVGSVEAFLEHCTERFTESLMLESQKSIIRQFSYWFIKIDGEWKLHDQTHYNIKNI